MIQRAVVLLSGGLDSATCLAAAKQRGLVCHCLTVDYSQRHRCELDAARALARSLGAAEHVVLPLNLRVFGGSALTDEIDVPKDGRHAQSGDSEADAIPVTYVPARNLVFLSMALAFAETRDAREIFIGANAVDYSGYPDCRPEFVRSFGATANLATKAGALAGEHGRRAFTIHTPLMELSKAGIIRLGTRLGVDYSLTHSCYDPGPGGAACGRCDSCLIRARGFAEAGVPDPTRYAASAGLARG